MRVKCLAQEHNTMSPAKAPTQTTRSGDERINPEATTPPHRELGSNKTSSGPAVFRFERISACHHQLRNKIRWCPIWS